MVNIRSLFDVNCLSQEIEKVWEIKHCEKTLHLTQISIAQSTFHCTHVYIDNFVALTKVFCHCTIHGLQFHFQHFTQIEQRFPTTLTSKTFTGKIELFWYVNLYSG